MDISLLLNPEPSSTSKSTPETTSPTQQVTTPADPQDGSLSPGGPGPTSPSTGSPSVADAVPPGSAPAADDMQWHFGIDLEGVSGVIDQVVAALQQPQPSKARAHRLLDGDVDMLDAEVDFNTEERFDSLGELVFQPDWSLERVAGGGQEVCSEYQYPTAPEAQLLADMSAIAAERRIDTPQLMQFRGDALSRQDISSALVSPTAQLRLSVSGSTHRAWPRQSIESTERGLLPAPAIHRTQSIGSAGLWDASRGKPAATPWFLIPMPAAASSTSFSEHRQGAHPTHDPGAIGYRHRVLQSFSRPVADYMETGSEGGDWTAARHPPMMPQTSGWEAVNSPRLREQESATGGKYSSEAFNSRADSDSSGGRNLTYPSRSSNTGLSQPTPFDAHPEQRAMANGTIPDLLSPLRPARLTHSRRTTARYAAGPPGRPFCYRRMGRSVEGVWREWKHGVCGNPPVADLEERYGTDWRGTTVQERKYGSNWVAVRRLIVEHVEAMCESQGLLPKEAARLLDDRVDGRMQELIKVLRAKKDPFEAIKERGEE